MKDVETGSAGLPTQLIARQQPPPDTNHRLHAIAESDATAVAHHSFIWARQLAERDLI